MNVLIGGNYLYLEIVNKIGKLYSKFNSDLSSENSCIKNNVHIIKCSKYIAYNLPTNCLYQGDCHAVT